MSDISGLLSSVESKTLKVLKYAEGLKMELASKEREIQQLKLELNNVKADNIELNKSLKTKRTAEILQESSSSKTAAKLKINELVREIDRCISLLNK